VIQRQLDCFARGAVWEDSFPLRRADGAYRWFLARAVPVRDESGAIREWFGSNTDVTEHMEALHEARSAKQLRDDMVAVVAHDLRNPVHTIALAAATLEAERLADAQRTRLLAIVRHTALDMGRLLDDLLDVSRMEAGTFAVARVPLHPDRLLEDTLQMFEARARDKGIDLVVGTDASLPEIAADRDRLRQVLSNLVGNSLKFTPRGGRIEATCGVAGEEIEFVVRDTGPGIDAEHLPRLFERFWKADPATRGGAGLGLAIARGIVEAHGGRIRAESERGVGTTIRFTVPIAS
jgi:signal transduction histidine kinase